MLVEMNAEDPIEMYRSKNTKDKTCRNRDKTLSGSGYVSVACTHRIEGEFHFVVTETDLIAFFLFRFCFWIVIRPCVP
jgi:hypothetical protein